MRYRVTGEDVAGTLVAGGWGTGVAVVIGGESVEAAVGEPSAIVGGRKIRRPKNIWLSTKQFACIIE
jgi:hypothetical protein